jgi:DNA repair protein RadC
MLLSANDKLAYSRPWTNRVRKQAADEERKHVIVLYLQNNIRLLDNTHGANVAVKKGN